MGGPRRSSAAAEEKSGSPRPAVLSTCQYFRRQSCSPGLFVSAGEKRYLMEWVVDGQTWYTAQTDHTEKFTCPWQSKFVFSCYYWTSADVISSVIAMPFVQHIH